MPRGVRARQGYGEGQVLASSRVTGSLRIAPPCHSHPCQSHLLLRAQAPLRPSCKPPCGYLGTPGNPGYPSHLEVLHTRATYSQGLGWHRGRHGGRERDVLKPTAGTKSDTSGINEIIRGCYGFENLEDTSKFLGKCNLQNCHKKKEPFKDSENWTSS